MEAIKKWLNNIFTTVGSVFTIVGDLSTWLYNTLFAYINPLDERFFGYAIIDGIIDGFSSLFSDIGSILDYLNPGSEHFFLKLAFVPNVDNLAFDDVKDTLYGKFPFISSIEENLNDFKEKFNNEESVPNLTVTLPSFLGVGTFSIIDFSFFNNYRGMIHAFIIAVSYFLFIFKLYKKMPSIVKGE